LKLRGGLAADARHARDVVYGVTHERKEVGHALRHHAEALGNVVVPVADVRHRVPVHVRRPDQLGQVLVPAHDSHRHADRARAHRERADDVVRLVARARELRDAQHATELAAQRELPPQLSWRGLAVGLVRG
jgi:hypothetical protein